MTRTVPIAEVSSASLRGLPGQGLRCLAELWLDRAALARVVDAALADVHAEWNQARAAGCTWQARAIALRGNAALLAGLSACGLAALRADLLRLASVGLGALLFPVLLFALLAEAIRPEAGPPRPPAPPIVRWWTEPLAPVIVPIRRTPPLKPPIKEARGPAIPGPGPIPREDKAPPRNPAGDGPLVSLTEPLPRVPRAAAGREADALPLVRIPPEYPPGLLQRGVEGFVVVRHWVGVRGEVTRAEVVQAYPRHAFERAALEAVYRWRYRPGESGGATVVRGPIEVLLEFSIEDAQR